MVVGREFAVQLTTATLSSLPWTSNPKRHLWPPLLVSLCRSYYCVFAHSNWGRWNSSFAFLTSCGFLYNMTLKKHSLLTGEKPPNLRCKIFNLIEWIHNMIPVEHFQMHLVSNLLDIELIKLKALFFRSPALKSHVSFSDQPLPSSVCLYVRPLHFRLFLLYCRPTLTKVSTNHPSLKGIQN
jgi:hypothetical protein